MALIIKNRTIVNDDWTVVRAAEDGTLPAVDALPAGKVVVPLALWQTARDQLSVARSAAEIGVWLTSDSEPANVVGDFDKIALIALDFPVFLDGRGFSVARLLRERYGYKGEIRAIGDVLRDQLAYMFRCGFDAYAVREDKDIQDALKAFDEFTVQYQDAVENPSPLFSRRATAPAAATVRKAAAEHG